MTKREIRETKLSGDLEPWPWLSANVRRLAEVFSMMTYTSSCVRLTWDLMLIVNGSEHRKVDGYDVRSEIKDQDSTH